MANITKVLREEIKRLAKKEIKTTTAGLHKTSVGVKRTIAQLKRRILEMERGLKRLLAASGNRPQKEVKVNDDTVEKARITAKMIRSIRNRLGLSQSDLADLLGVSSQTVYQWEHKKGRLDFRGDIKARIVGARKLQKREAQMRLEKLKEGRD